MATSLVIAVRDSGPGIANPDNLFVPFLYHQAGEVALASRCHARSRRAMAVRLAWRIDAMRAVRLRLWKYPGPRALRR